MKIMTECFVDYQSKSAYWLVNGEEVTEEEYITVAGVIEDWRA